MGSEVKPFDSPDFSFQDVNVLKSLVDFTTETGSYLLLDVPFQSTCNIAREQVVQPTAEAGREVCVCVCVCVCACVCLHRWMGACVHTLLHHEI